MDLTTDFSATIVPATIYQAAADAWEQVKRLFGQQLSEKSERRLPAIRTSGAKS